MSQAWSLDFKAGWWREAQRSEGESPAPAVKLPVLQPVPVFK
jgi:hypothetical protein